jgi:hypothetical protein
VYTVQYSSTTYTTVLLFGRTIKYCVTNIGRKFPTSLSTLSYKTPVFPTDSTLQCHKSNTLIHWRPLGTGVDQKSLNWTLPCQICPRYFPGYFHSRGQSPVFFVVVALERLQPLEKRRIFSWIYILRGESFVQIHNVQEEHRYRLRCRCR